MDTISKIAEVISEDLEPGQTGIVPEDKSNEPQGDLVEVAKLASHFGRYAEEILTAYPKRDVITMRRVLHDLRRGLDAADGEINALAELMRLPP